MNITDSSGKWQLDYFGVTNRKTGQYRTISNLPSHNELAQMSEKTFVKNCERAFYSGKWGK
jgi:hypothetical protein